MSVWRWWQNQGWRALGLALPVFVLLWLAQAAGLLVRAELQGFDLYNRWMALPGPSARTVVIGFNEQDFRHVPSYPYADAVLADLLERVVAGKPRVIVLNVVRDIPVEPGHARLLEVYRRAPMLFGMDLVRPGEPGELGVSAPPVLREAGRWGFPTSLTDLDGVTRAALLADTARQPPHEHVLTRAARLALAAQGVRLDIAADGSLVLDGRSHPPLDPRRTYDDQAWSDSWAAQQIPQRYQSDALEVSFDDVLKGRVDATVFTDRSVVIGTTAPSMARFLNTPLVPISGRGIAAPHWMAHSLDNLYAVALDGWPVLRQLPGPVNHLGLFLLAWLACLSFLHVRSLGGWALRAGLWAAALVSGGYLAYRAGWWLPVVPALLTLLLALGLVFNNLVRSEAQQRRLLDTFRRVFDQLPDPVYVLDEAQHFVLINRAFGELALRVPDALLKQPAASLLGALQPEPLSGLGERILKVPGAQHALRVRESSAPGSARGQWTVGVVQSVRALPAVPGVAEADSCPADARFAAAAYWARSQGSPLALAWLELHELDLLEAAYGAERLPAIDRAILARLQRAFPDAVLCERPQATCFQLLLARRASAAAPLRQLLAQAFSWPLDLGPDAPAVEVDLQVGCAFLGADGETLDALRNQARARVAPLPAETPG